MTSPTALGESSIRSFTAATRAVVIRPGDEEYDRSRRVWNGMIDRSPALIVRCRDVEDVVGAVRLARESGAPLAVRGGGHNAAGLAVCDGGVVIDLGLMREVRVDPDRRTARVQGGATWGDLDRATAAHGLATTGGVISTTGVAGLTLGGGLGWLMRSYGLACDNLESAEVVTASGHRVTASATENPDLLWGLRGGGGNFGVVTALEFRLYPVTTVLGGMLVHPRARAPELVRFYRDFMRTAPDRLTAFCALLTSPDGVPIVGILLCYNGPVDEGAEVVRPLREFGPPVADQVAPMPYATFQSILDEGFPSGLHVYWRSDFLRRLDDQAIDAVIDHANRAPSPLTAVLLEHFGGAVARVGPGDTAFPHRDADYNLVVISRWSDPAAAEPNVAWTRDFTDAMRPHSRGVYVNYLGVGEGQDRVRAAYGVEPYERLVALKNKYDPTNLFRFNQNIRPSV